MPGLPRDMRIGQLTAQQHFSKFWKLINEKLSPDSDFSFDFGTLAWRSDKMAAQQTFDPNKAQNLPEIEKQMAVKCVEQVSIYR